MKRQEERDRHEQIDIVNAISDEQNMLEQRRRINCEEDGQGMEQSPEDNLVARSRRRNGGRSSFFNSWLLNFDNKLPILVLLFTVLLVSPVLSTVLDKNWDDCHPCSCKWTSGKKAANCQGRKFTKVPQDLSTELQTIDLSQNDIAEIRKNEFYDANVQNVHKLYMRNCTLQYVHRDAMKGLDILIELDLSFNNLRELPVGFFHPMVKLRKLLLNHNQIEVIEDGLFHNLTFLHKIELKGNRIHTVGLTAFILLPSLSEINLDMNQLTRLKKASFDSMDKLNSLSIMQNPWNCTCDLEEFKEFVVNRNLYMQPICHDPPALRGRSWGDLTEKFACRPRVLRIYPASRFRSLAENETLECEVYGSPRPKIDWLFNNKPLNSHDHRLKLRAVESYTKNGADVFVTKLTIVNVVAQDKGAYVCVASNAAGKDEGVIYVERSNGPVIVSRTIFGNIYVVIALILLIILALFAMVISILICCRRGSVCPKLVGNKKYKNGNNNKSTMSERGLIQSKLNDKTQNESMIEGGSVIMEMQKSLLTEVNPVEKPPRRTEVDANGSYHDGMDDKSDLKKTLLDETAFGNYQFPINITTFSHTPFQIDTHLTLELNL